LAVIPLPGSTITLLVTSLDAEPRGLKLKIVPILASNHPVPAIVQEARLSSISCRLIALNINGMIAA
jgi:hypothetical protein